jgi:hypothetical protein
MNYSKPFTVLVTTTNYFDVPAEVVVWNYFDAEHLPYIHKNYDAPRILVRHGDTVLFLSRLKVPGLPVYFKTSNLTFVPSFGAQTTITTTAIAVIRTEIRLSEVEPGRTKVDTEYTWYLHRLLRPLGPVLRKKILEWSRQITEEDRPLRERRALLQARGFSDFYGMKRVPENNRHVIVLPMKVPPDSPILYPHFSIETRRRVSLDFIKRTVYSRDRG